MLRSHRKTPSLQPKMCNPCARIKVLPMSPIAHNSRARSDRGFRGGVTSPTCELPAWLPLPEFDIGLRPPQISALPRGLRHSRKWFVLWPAAPPTALRAVPPPRSGEGSRVTACETRGAQRSLRRFHRSSRSSWRTIAKPNRRQARCGIPHRNGEGGPRESRWVGLEAQEHSVFVRTNP